LATQSITGDEWDKFEEEKPESKQRRTGYFLAIKIWEGGFGQSEITWKISLPS